MQVVPLGGPIFNWRHQLVAKITTDASSASWCPHLQSIQVVAQRTHQLSLQLELSKIKWTQIQFSQQDNSS